MSPMPEETPRRLIGPYEAVERLEGQATEVYLARLSGEHLRPRFILVLFEVRVLDARIIEAEVERCKRIDHQAVTRPVEMFEHEGRRVLVFEGVPGTNLDRLMKQLQNEGERLPDVAVYHIGHSLFSALHVAHTLRDEQGAIAPVAHGQLGPHQVMVSWSGAITIMGFGMSRLYHLAETMLAEHEDLRAFLAPEQRAGYAATPRGNVYSAAAIVWFLLTNELPPIDGSKPQSLRERRSDLPGDLAECIDRALEAALTQRNITCEEVAAAFAEYASGEGQRELRWIVDIVKGLGEGTLNLVSPDSFTPRNLAEVPNPWGRRPLSMPPAADDNDVENALSVIPDSWEEAGGADISAGPGGVRRKAPAADRSAKASAPPIAPPRPRPAGLPALRKGGSAAKLAPAAKRPLFDVRRSNPPPFAPATGPDSDQPPTPSLAIPRAAPLPLPAVEELGQADDGLANEEEESARPNGDPEVSASRPDVAGPSVGDDGEELLRRVEEEDGEDDDGYVRPSLRPGALAEAPFVTPSNYPPAIGGLPFQAPQDLADPAAATGGLDAVGAGRRFRLTTESVSVKWAALLVVAVLFAFVAGMLVASGPVQLKVGEAPSAAEPGARKGPPPGDDSSRSKPMPTPARAPGAPSQTASADSSTTTPSGEPETALDGPDGSELPPNRGYLIVHCPEHPELRVYVIGKVARLGDRIVVPCGLTNVRLGTFPLGTWYGLGKSVPVACKSVTEVRMKAGEPVSPGRERGQPSAPQPSQTASATTATDAPAPTKDDYED